MIDRSYRLYHLCHEGQIRGAVNRDFHDDSEALEHARGLLDEHTGVEVWQTNRLVGRLNRPAFAGER